MRSGMLAAEAIYEQLKSAPTRERRGRWTV
jgi:hypothetical protein